MWIPHGNVGIVGVFYDGSMRVITQQARAASWAVDDRKRHDVGLGTLEYDRMMDTTSPHEFFGYYARTYLAP